MREAKPFLSHSFDSEFTQRSQPGGRDFGEERSGARLNLKCQMLYFDFMEKGQFRGSNGRKAFLPYLKKKKRSEGTGINCLF